MIPEFLKACGGDDAPARALAAAAILALAAKSREQFEAYRSVDDALTDMRKTTVPTILPRLVITPTGVGMELDE